MAPQNLDELRQIIAANRTPRYCELNRLEAFVETTQYDDRTSDWFDGSEKAPPLRERRPCIAYPIVKTAIDSNVDLCLGEGKFPAFQLTDGDDKEGGTEEDSLSEDQRKVVDAGLTKLTDLARLRPVFRSALATAQGQRTAVLICGIRNDKPFVDLEKAKRCTPEFAADGTVSKLTVRYVYTVDVQDRDGKWEKRAKLYKRVIDDRTDTTFKAVDAKPDGKDPSSWPIEVSVQHGLGFCPVVWYRHMAGCTTAGQIDGRSVHEHCLDEIEALDMVLSQWHRAAFFAGDPQGYEVGVDDQDGPMARGRAAEVLSTPAGGPMGEKNQVNGRYVSAVQGKARKKGPGEWWRYGSPNVKVGYLTLPGDALKAIQDHCGDLREKVAESLGIVFNDPETARRVSALSGKAQQMLRQRQLDRCDQYRDDMDDGLIVPVLHMLLRILRLKPPKSAAIRQMLKMVAKLGEEPSISLRWGPYYDPEPAEEKSIAEFLAAVDKVLPLTTEMKLRKLQRPLGIENIEAAAEELDKEREARDQKAKDEAEAAAKTLMNQAHGDGTPVKPRAGGPAGAGAAGNAGGGGRAPAAATPPSPAARK